jgi:microcystin-dependent protein
MSDVFLGEIRIFGFNFAPQGWALCNGQLLPISQNTALFSLLGVQYGGNGQSTFALPNLQGQVAMGQGSGAGLTARINGESAGLGNVTLANTQIPVHTHPAACSTGLGDQYVPSGNIWATDAGGNNEYATSHAAVMNATATGLAGGGQPHSNLQPYLVMNFCIALTGIFPSRS